MPLVYVVSRNRLPYRAFNCFNKAQECLDKMIEDDKNFFESTNCMMVGLNTRLTNDYQMRMSSVKFIEARQTGDTTFKRWYHIYRLNLE